MKKIGLIFLLILAFAVFTAVAIQFVPYGRNHTNPPVLADPQWDSPATRQLFFRACGDCHSNETAWPWYTNVAPVSWLIQRDVDEGRAKFNVSEWGRPGENEAEDAAELVQNGEMPLPIYLVMHPEARLSAAEKNALIQGLIATFGGEAGGEGGEEGEDD
jgi:mono/diheme cytochrome c family protein